MAHNNGVISKPINVVGDIAYVLGRDTGNVGQLCGDVDGNGDDVGAIKKWSLKKPVRHTNPGELTVAQFEEANYGFACQKYSTVSDAYQHRADSWEYLKPRGAGRPFPEWYRVTDFDGYNHGATSSANLFSLSGHEGAIIYTGENPRIDFTMPSDIDYWAFWSGISGQKYIGVYAVFGNTKYYYPLTYYGSQTTIADLLTAGHFTIPLTSSVFSTRTGTWTFYLVMSDWGEYDSSDPWTPDYDLDGTWWIFLPNEFTATVANINYSLFCDVDGYYGRNTGDTCYFNRILISGIVFSGGPDADTQITLTMRLEEYDGTLLTLGTQTIQGMHPSGSLSFGSGSLLQVESDDGLVPVYLDYSFTRNGTTYSGHQLIDTYDIEWGWDGEN